MGTCKLADFYLTNKIVLFEIYFALHPQI